MKTLYSFYDYPCNFALSENIKRLLRFADFGGPKTFKCNWGDWYCFSDVTMIRVYGFEGSPLLLPKIMPDRIAYLEIIRQMGDSSHMHLGSHEKQAFMPETLCVGEFIINGREGHEITWSKLVQYDMKLGAPRKNFDPKGYIHLVRKKQKLGDYEHIPYMRDDLIRNMDEKEVKLAIDNHNREMDKKARERQTIDVSSSEDEELSEGDEVSFEKFSKMLTEEQVSPVKDLDEEVPIEEDPRQLACKDFISNDNFTKSLEFHKVLFV